MRPESALRRFEAYLKRKGMRATKPRREILKLAWSTHGHFTAEELVQWARDEDASLSRATVYRTIGLLVGGGFLAALDGGRGQMLYEHILGHDHHDHMICMECGKIIEFRNDEIEALQREIAASRNFHLVQHTLTLEGYCAACARSSRSRSAGADS